MLSSQMKVYHTFFHTYPVYEIILVRVSPMITYISIAFISSNRFGYCNVKVFSLLKVFAYVPSSERMLDSSHKGYRPGSEKIFPPWCNGHSCYWLWTSFPDKRVSKIFWCWWYFMYLFQLVHGFDKHLSVMFNTGTRFLYFSIISRAQSHVWGFI